MSCHDILGLSVDEQQLQSHHLAVGICTHGQTEVQVLFCSIRSFGIQVAPWKCTLFCMHEAQHVAVAAKCSRGGGGPCCVLMQLGPHLVAVCYKLCSLHPAAVPCCAVPSHAALSCAVSRCAVLRWPPSRNSPPPPLPRQLVSLPYQQFLPLRSFFQP